MGLARPVLGTSVSARAAPPFVDPEPLERFHSEVNVATQATRACSGQVGTEARTVLQRDSAMMGC